MLFFWQIIEGDLSVSNFTATVLFNFSEWKIPWSQFKMPLKILSCCRNVRKKNDTVKSGTENTCPADGDVYY